MRTNALLLGLVVGLAGCRANIPTGVFDCDDDNDCPPDQACIEGTCHDDDVDAGARADAGPMDAASTDDVRGLDAFIADDAVTADDVFVAPDALVADDAVITPDAFVSGDDAFSLPDAVMSLDAFAPPDSFAPTDAFVSPDATMCASPCGLLPQCGCASDQACYLGPPDGCFFPGTTAPGLACVTHLSCEGGDVCVDASLDGARRPACRAVCRGDDDCAGDTLCTAPLGLPGHPDLGMCTVACSLYPQSGCSPMLTCVIGQTTVGGPQATDCQGPVGTATTGMPCSSNLSCAPGFGCAGGLGCRRFCNVALADCEGGDTCAPSVALNGINWGVCVP